MTRDLVPLSHLTSLPPPPRLLDPALQNRKLVLGKQPRDNSGELGWPRPPWQQRPPSNKRRTSVRRSQGLQRQVPVPVAMATPLRPTKGISWIACARWALNPSRKKGAGPGIDFLLEKEEEKQAVTRRPDVHVAPCADAPDKSVSTSQLLIWPQTS